MQRLWYGFLSGEETSSTCLREEDSVLGPFSVADPGLGF